MKNELRIIVKQKNSDFTQRYISDSLNEMQEIVGGRIECPILSHVLEDNRISIFINEDGKLFYLEPTLLIVDSKTSEVVDYIAGTYFFSSYDDDGQSVSITNVQEEIIEKLVHKNGATINNRGIDVLFI